jgi:SHS2 domain-containing protein
MKSFEYLEHTADAEFIAYGQTADEAFENAALAMTGLMLDTKTVKPEIEKDVELAGDALDTLLYDWLSELLYIFEVDRLIFGRFEANVTGVTGDYHLKARAFGESVKKHPDIFLHIKAVTFHDLRFEKRNNIYEAQVLLDI